MPPTAPREFEFLGMRAIVASPRMLAALDLAGRVAKTNATVLIQGESGSGKEVIARALHHLSMRCKRPWVDVSCGALPEHLMESELFGYERGAFSGADTAKPGLFELAQGGTLFLDEVGELEPKMQVKLLRVLDGTPYYRLGGTRKITVDVRVLAATNANLEEGVAAGRFRRDLYHRLSQMTLRVPALRERPEDVEALARFFLHQQSPEGQISADGFAALRHYHWPGNVRELRNVVTRAAILAGDQPLSSHDFDLPSLTLAAPPGPVALPPPAKHQAGNLDGVERQTILRVLRETNGHRQRAAEVLGISRRTLSRKLKLYRLAEHSLDEIPLGRVWNHGKQLPGKTA